MTGWRGCAAALLAALLAALVPAVAACGGQSEAPGTPFTGTEGAALYAQACASCHGADLRGSTQGPPFLDAIYRPGHHADAAFLLAVRRGVRAHHWDFGGMPAIAGLSDEQVEAITRFVRDQQRAEGID